MKKKTRQGAVLLGLVIIMTVLTALGAAILSLSISAGYTKLHANSMNQAIYLTESGCRHVLLDPTATALPPGIDYTMSDGSTYNLSTVGNLVQCEAVVNKDSFFEAGKTLICAPDTYFVDNENGDDTNNGISWNNAFKTVQQAINIAGDGSDILVGYGSSGTTVYELSAGITISGKDLRLTSARTGQDRYYDSADDNAKKCILRRAAAMPGFRLVTFDDSIGPVTDDTILRGFTIAGSTPACGAADSCGGIACTSIIEPVEPVISDCIIKDNTSNSDGGGIYCEQSYPTIKRCKIFDNRADNGGAISIVDSGASKVLIENCLIHSNNASGDGDGIYIKNSNVDIHHCTIADNTGTGIYNDTNIVPNAVTVENSIVWGNTGMQIDENCIAPSTPPCTTITSCYTVGDPLFANGYSLRYCPPCTATSCSPCIDNAATGAIDDLLGVQRPQLADYDQGAYEIKDVTCMAGSGIPADPWQVKTPYHLQNVGAGITFDDGSGNNYALSDAYILVNDIDMSDSKNFTPIGNALPFTGLFDGQGNVIRELYIDDAATDDIGLFSVISGSGTVQNLGIESASVTGSDNVGILAGHVDNGSVSSVYTTGSVRGRSQVGGLVGRVSNGASAVTDAYSRAQVTYYVASPPLLLLGSPAGFGGLIGKTFDTPAISNCYATGQVDNALPVPPPASCDYRRGGLIGVNDAAPTVNNSYFDCDVFGDCVTVPPPVPLTKVEMMNQSSYIGWDFTTIWYPPNGAPPLLRY